MDTTRAGQPPQQQEPKEQQAPTPPAPTPPAPTPPAPTPPAPARTPPPAPKPLTVATRPLTAEQQAKIKAKLDEKGVTQPCPRCGNPDFVLVNNGILNPAMQDLNNAVIGVTVPSIITVCNKCGYLALHALGTLGFLKGGKVDF